ncbi:MAG: FAD-dependent oxidoreductase, partial [Actinobacteria bacterium]|nr:FAD-dependent oxidoreductase [Actinomycetota bacterium]
MLRRQHSRPSVPPTLPPWWLDEALASEEAAPTPPPLEGDLHVNVAIVGGGYTGL